MKSLYVHFPFCEAKCHYCDFYSLARDRVKDSDVTAFERALKLEASRLAPLLSSQLDTIFFGGGTPSMTDPENMRRALEPLALEKRVTENTEWTMEANPSSIELENMRGYRALGVNRVSMGVQALREDLLKDLGRVHSRGKALEALDTVFTAGFDNVSVDLLCGVPRQTLADVENALDELTSFPITHLSCYLLTLPKHHPMHKDLPDENTQLEHLLMIDRWMKNRGFEHYEISNFAKLGKEARHNLRYWKGESYLGLGPSAHSFDAAAGLHGKRWKNVSSIHLYSQKLEKGETALEWSETLTAEQKDLEKWMLGLRLSEGFPATWLDTPGRRTKAQVFEKEALLERHPHYPDRIRLTARGFSLSDQIIQSFS